MATGWNDDFVWCRAQESDECTPGNCKLVMLLVRAHGVVPISITTSVLGNSSFLTEIGIENGNT